MCIDCVFYFSIFGSCVLMRKTYGRLGNVTKLRGQWERQIKYNFLLKPKDCRTRAIERKKNHKLPFNRLRVLADEFPVCSNLVKFFHHTPNLKQLNLDGWVLQYLTVGGLPESPPTALNNVRNLNISHMSFENIEEVVGAVYLITRCPRLQYFSMDASIENVEEAGVQFIKAQANSYGGMKVLQKVCMLLIYGGLEPQTEFLRFILSSAPALEEIYILNHAFPDDQVMQMIHEMKQFPCASRNVKFKYEELGTDIVMEVP
ncbi:F-box/FBD/LRR-repeat protein At1g13570-like isoform X4 [Lycium barbarum]|uniref:F-box/FBD/LRR-repeat protein At1g13570-like isoform X4 n=1 Tax=Lycium barbarum TaxID=112863 RepID=UPI00293E02EC|nr:F-box/FBD/LRR-repeat protein At1g13570-like isoform X4 [Lycium barbarum]